MNTKDKQRLKELMADEVIKLRKHTGNVFVIELAEGQQLDEDSGQFYTTFAELLRFKMDEDEIPMVACCYFGYEQIHDLCSPSVYGGELANLLPLYREELQGFVERYFSEDHFAHFATEIGGVSEQTARGFYQKRLDNTKHLAP